MQKKKDAEYEGWREPKIAMSFHRNRLKYYGVVWLIIVTFVLLKDGQKKCQLPHFDLIFKTSCVEEFHNQGLQVRVQTLNDLQTGSALIAIGVDMVKSDYPRALFGKL